MNFPAILTGTDASIEANLCLVFETANVDAQPFAPTPEQVEADDRFWEELEDMETSAAPAGPRKFVVGQVYGTRSICDHDCIFRWKITRRTDKSVWVQSVRVTDTGEFVGYGKITRRVLDVDYGGENELIYPNGTYSMCPVLTADKGDLA